ncbi:MAG: hypothetical protein Q8N23_11100 [Archangium sp.]|nr:hypothetical protein [Archangium sp.]MDP3153210.1 hypothetical protein [Archangium sp.]
MPTRVDDRTQVLLVSLKTEAQLLKAWIERRAEVAQRRQDGPAEALRHRVGLLEREVPRLEREVAGLEASLLAHAKPRPPVSTWLSGFLRGTGLVIAALLWVVGVVSATPSVRLDDPVRLASMLGVVAVVALCRR